MRPFSPLLLPLLALLFVLLLAFQSTAAVRLDQNAENGQQERQVPGGLLVKFLIESYRFFSVIKPLGASADRRRVRRQFGWGWGGHRSGSWSHERGWGWGR